MQGMSGKTHRGTQPLAFDYLFIHFLSAVYHQDHERSSFLAADQWPSRLLSLYFPYARHVRDKKISLIDGQRIVKHILLLTILIHVI